MALTPSNMEGGTERSTFCDNQTALKPRFQFAFAHCAGVSELAVRSGQ